jgi:hypothetical protein
VVAVDQLAITRSEVLVRERRRCGLEGRPALVEEADALLDALQGPLHVALEALENAHRVVIGAGTDPLTVGMRLFDDPLALGLGRLGQAALVDEEGRLLLRASDDALGLLLGLLDDALALGVDALRRTNLLRDGDTELVDEPEGGVLVDDNVRRERQLLAVGDQRLEALDEEDDVDVVCPPACSIMARADASATPYERSNARRNASWAGPGTIVDTSPPNEAISFTRLELT